MITPQTPWRRIGAVPADTWRTEFQAKGSPMLADAVACCEAAGPHGALALVQAWVESQYGTTGRLAAHRNPLGLRPAPDRSWPTAEVPGAGTFIAFGAWADAFAEWRRRLFDEADTYKQGAYAKAGPTLLNLVEVYCPKGPPGTPEASNEPEQYAASLARELRRLGAPILEDTTMPELVFGKVPHPDYIDAIVPKRWEGAGFNTVPPRGPGLVGTCLHSWGGGAWTQPAWRSIFQLFAPDGERHHDALVDYSVQKDGSIVRLNDPRGTRCPHANGGSSGLKGDGPAFVRKLGAGAVNSRLVSIEREGGPEPMPRAQLESVAALIAYWHDQAKVPWHAFPLHPALGIVTQMQHWEFSGDHAQGSGCPFPGVQGQTDEYQDRARAIMRQHQTGTVQLDPVPPPKPVENPGKDWWPKGYTVAALASRFGGLPRVKVAGTAATADGPHAFDPDGVVSNAWVKRGADAKLTVDQLPRPVRWLALSHDDPDVITYDRVEWDNGWVLERRGLRAGWVWAV